MKRWLRNLTWLTFLSSSLSAVTLAYMKYLMLPVNKYAVINHPWQNGMRKIHIFSSFCFVFVFGSIFAIHVLPRLKNKVARRIGKKTGITLLYSLIALTISGYWFQVVVDEDWQKYISLSHLYIGLGSLILYYVHQYRVQSVSKNKISSSALIFLLLASGIILFKFI